MIVLVLLVFVNVQERKKCLWARGRVKGTVERWVMVKKEYSSRPRHLEIVSPLMLNNEREACF